MKADITDAQKALWEVVQSIWQTEFQREPQGKLGAITFIFDVSDERPDFVNATEGFWGVSNISEQAALALVAGILEEAGPESFARL
ncbi:MULTISPECIES: hypothetical protein [unclassified Rhizobium]|uniref:hypothetical protein n=1 Tax=unclassified Rhizobium TaxID=2613769 RepID=UPI0021686EE2|nr:MULTISPECIES: hypothetical protein [unclassified Rhizobium]MCS3742600.1 hypothetical protein [Rhizobium sp. BK661]MCS4094566.1 hypothetical protein [Rhizobium sp. BK176]